MELRQYLMLVRRWIWLLALGAVLGGSVAFFVSYYQAPVYQTTAKIFVSQPPRDQLSDLGYLSGQQLIQTYAHLLTTDPILEVTSQRLGRPVSAGQITVSQIRDTQILSVTVADGDPNWAAAIANTVIDVFIEQQYIAQTSRYAASKQSLATNLEEQRQLVDETVRQLEALEPSEENQLEIDRLEANLSQYRQTYANILQSYENVRIAEAQSTPNVERVEPAEPAGSPIRPQPMRSMMNGIVIGLMAAGGIIFLVEYLDDTIRSPVDVVQKLQLPILGYVAEMAQAGRNGKNQLYTATQPRSPISEAFRSLRTNLEFAGAAKSLHTILITSPGPEEGKTTVATNLAVVMAQGGKRVVLLDGDLRRPRVHRMLDIQNNRGLSEYFRNREGIRDISQTWGGNNLFVITSGKLPPNPAELLGSEKMTQLLDRLSELADVVIIDSPPFIVADSLVLSAMADGVLLVIQPGRTNMGATQTALEQFDRAGARVVGVVLNKITRSNAYYYRRYNPYYYYSGNQYYYESTNHQGRLDDTQPLARRKRSGAER